MFLRKKLKTSPKVAAKPDKPDLAEKPDLLDGLPDDLVVYILSKLSSSASCPSDFINVLLTCKRLNHLGLHPLVLSKAGTNTLSIRAKNWSESAHRFLKLCVNAGNTDSAYALGMFNGSGASRNEKDLRAGVALCARAAFLGHIDAPEMHPVNRFLKEWFESGKGELAPGLRLCSHSGCGRPETRSHEFRRCSVCGTVNYCSRGCQALDWKLRHKKECVPMDRWIIEDDGDGV
ncbi:hypothetical protein Patl1_18311 [Pistacia atlantica]|uniref:Uncharacterized protein n=1 Tax=Pistacia atlantica TaxID=434234 RepID=A0ACC1C0Z5_9ROSI|nr:hypothetical protein Patl1_18311 [Pistacia atlantica]